MKIKTIALQEAVSRVIKGVGKVSTIAITSAIILKNDEKDLVLETTDNVNVVEYRIKDVCTEDFYVCTDANLFIKLVQKTTSDYIELVVTDGYLQYTGSGMYNIALIMDEEGNMGSIKKPDFTGIEAKKVNCNDLKSLLLYNKQAVAKTFEEPIYTGYALFDDCCITFNNIAACMKKMNIGLKCLLPQSFVELLSIIDDKECDFYSDGKNILVKTPTTSIYGTMLEGFENYPEKDIKEFLGNEGFNNYVKLSKVQLLSILDRISLFVTEQTQSEVVLNFRDNDVIISNKDSNACEQLKYIESRNVEAISLPVNLKDIQGITSIIDGEFIELYFGKDVNSIKFIIKDSMEYAIPILTEENDNDK